MKKKKLLISLTLLLAISLVAGAIFAYNDANISLAQDEQPVSQEVGAFVPADLNKKPPEGMIRVAAVQCHREDMEEQEAVVEKLMDLIDTATHNHAKLMVFPECILPEDETVPGPTSDAFTEKCGEENCYCVFGGHELFGIDRYNVDYLVGPQGLIGKYRKTHPWGYEQEDVEIGDLGYPVFDTPIGRIGLIICYDLWFPEPPRIMALDGADILAFSTWAIKDPAGEAMFDHVMQTRGMENHVWVIGTDIAAPQGIGRSQIIDPWGDIVAQAGAGEEIIYADIDVKAANRDKQLQPGNIASDMWSERLPETYGLIIAPMDEVAYGAHYKWDYEFSK